jgi:hypothetical protein
MEKKTKAVWGALGLFATTWVAGGALAQTQIQVPDIPKSDVRTLSDDLGDGYCMEPVDAFQLEANFGRLLRDAAVEVAKEAGKNALMGSFSNFSPQATLLKQARETAKGLNWLPLPVEEHSGGLENTFKSVGKDVGGVFGSLGSMFGSSSPSPKDTASATPAAAQPANDSAHPDFPDRLANGKKTLVFWKAHNPAPLQTFQMPTKAP